MSQFQAFADLEKDGWNSDQVAEGYSTKFAAASDMVIPAILNQVEGKAEVLDLCCGHGNVTRALHANGHDVIGADFAPTMLEIARKSSEGIRYDQADAQNLPYEDASFDAVTCSFGLMHVPDQPKALGEIRRVLKPSGIFVMSCWVGPDRSPAFKALFSAVGAHGAKGIGLPDSPDFHQFAREDDAESLFDAAGLELRRQIEVACYWRVSNPEDVFDIFMTSAPRAGHILRNQPPDNRARIGMAMAENVAANYRNGDGYDIPIPAICNVGAPFSARLSA